MRGFIMTKRINKDTQVCMSLAARPSNFGTLSQLSVRSAGSQLSLQSLADRLTQAISGGVRGLGIVVRNLYAI